MPAESGAVLLGSRSVLDLPWQAQAWRFYGTPDGTAAANIRMNRGAIGEVRFVMGWIAQQIARVGWFVKIDGEQLTAEKAAEMMALVANEESTIIISTNLIVAGELNYMCLSPDVISEIYGRDWETTVGIDLPGSEDGQWLTVSVIDPFRTKFFDAAKSGLNIRGIWAHPAKPITPDPPLAAVLDVLAEIEQLGDLAYSQNRSRIANMGILTIANELEMANVLPNGTGTAFSDQVEAVINSPILDPRRTSAAPILFRAPFEYMTGALSNGARAVQWTRPDLETYTDTIESRMRFAIQRLAWGFPVAPEILLGMTATNRAVAFQIEESTYRAYIEPICDLVGRVYARALRLRLDGDPKVEVLPDATDLLARRHSIADAKDLYDRGLVAAPYVRRVAGIPEEDAGTQADIDRIVLLRKGQNPGDGRELDPSEVAGNEPVRAGASIEGDLASALRGAIDLAQAAAVSRVGASARTRLSRMPANPSLELDPEAVPNNRLPSLLGVDRLASLNLNMNSAIGPASAWLEDWLEARVLEEMPEAWEAGRLQEAQELLRAQFSDWCCATVCSWPMTRAPAVFSDSVLAILEPLQPQEEGNA